MTVMTPTITSFLPNTSVVPGNTNLSYDNTATLNGTATPNTIVSIYDGTTLLGTAAVTSNGAWTYTTGPLANGTQSFTVTDKDTAGNVSQASSALDATAQLPSGNALVNFGVNMDGAEYSWGTFPSMADLLNVKSEGVDIVRLPIAWEMMQPTLNGPLNSSYLTGLETFLNNAASLGIQVIVDVHDAGRYDVNWAADAASNYGIVAPDGADASVIGSAAVPISAFANFWGQLASALAGNPGVAAYDIMNEPYNMGGASVWPDAAQAAVNAIRSVDMNTTIMVEGDQWANAQYWAATNENLNIIDPANKIVYEAHQYFDNGSGTYSETYAQQGDTSTTGSQEVQPFLNWLQQNNDKGFLGEFGVPSNNPQWLPVLDNVLNTLEANGVSGTIWNYEMPQPSDPAWWDAQIENTSNPGNLNIAPVNGQISPQMALLFDYSTPAITWATSSTANVLTLSGIGAGDDSVNVYDGSVLIGTTTSSANGAWSFTTSALSDGSHSFTVNDEDSAGDISETSSAFSISVASTAPTVASVAATGTGIANGSGDLDAGHVVTLTVNLSEAVTVAGGTPTLTLNDGGTASYTGGSGTNALTFSYTVAAGQNTADLAVSAVSLGTATVTDAAGNAANLAGAVTAPAGTLQIDTTAPTVASVAATGTGIANGSGDLDAGHVVTLTVNLSEAVTVAGGTPTLTLNDGGTASYTGGSGTNALTFSYTVAAGQNTADLAVSAVSLGTATVTDAAGNAANLAGAVTTPAGTLQIDTTAPTVASVAATGTGIANGSGDLDAGHVVTLTVNLSEAVTVAGGTPTLTLNDGGTASYTGGSGTNALTFSYTVAAGQNTADLAVSAVSLGTATVTDAAGNAANLAGAVTAPAGTLQIDTTAPTVASVAATGTGIANGSGDLDAGHVVTLTVNLSEAVTVAGGTPTLTLNDGGTASYTGGSGTNALTFGYTVAAGQNTADLAVSAVSLGTATVTDAAGNAANLAGAVTAPAGTLQIDTTAPTVASVAATGTGIANGSGDLDAGHVVTLTVNLSEAVTVAGGTPTLTLNDGGTASYTGGSGTNALTFGYTVAAGQNTADLAVSAVSLGTATVTDAAGNAANLAGAVTAPAGTLQIDTTAPTVASVAATGTGIANGSGDLDAGHVVTLTVNLSEAVTVAGGTPTLTLNDGGTASYTGGSGTNALTFSYTVAAGQNTADLAVSAVSLGTATVTDAAGNAANLAGAVTAPAGTLQIDTTAPTVASVAATGTGIANGSGDLDAGHVVTLTVNLSEAVTVAGGTPTLTLNDGGTASYTGGSGTNALTFSYTVAAGQNTADLAVSAVSLGTATVTDAAGNAANLSGAVTTPAGTLQIDTTAPTVASVAATGTGIANGSGDLDAGHVVTLTVNLSEAVTVAGGTPTLTLNDGGTASYTGGSGTNALTFSYTVAAGQNTAGLAVSAVSLGTATVTDAAGNAANLSGAVTAPAGTLQIDTTAPTVASVAATGTGIANGSGDLDAGHVVTLTVNLSEAVTVAGGTPTLTLNDGGTASYTGGSGTNALTFSYTVAAGQNTADLAVSAVSLGTATVTDAAGNAANLAGAVTAPAGTLQIDTTTPAISAIGETPSSGDLNAGKTVTYTITFSEAVTVNTTSGKPTLTFNDGGTATYIGGSGTNALTFSYAVQAGQNTPDLKVSAFNLNGASIADGAGNSANLSLTGIAQGSPQIDTTPPTVASVSAAAGDYNVGKTLTLTLNTSEAVNVSGTPTLTLNDGGTAAYVSGSGSTTLTFSYTVASGQNTSALVVTGVAGTITDLAGNALSSAGLPQSLTGVIIDTTTPTVSSLVASGAGITAGSGDLGVGSVVTLTVNLSEAVTVAGGTPTLTLNDGGTASYTGGSGTNALTFSYTVAAGQNTADLAVSAVSLGTATVTDAAGNAANLAGAVTTPAGTLQIDTATQTLIQTDGTTSLVSIGSNYFLNKVGSNATGPELSYNGAPVTAGEFGSWTPIGAVQTATGYDIAWKSGANAYTIWSTDSSGNYSSSLTATVAGNSTTLEAFETTFQQDLNGDGTIGVPTTVIQTDGTTSLVSIGSNYFLDKVGSNATGPELSYNGAPVTAGEFGSWTPIGAVQTATGYDIAWKSGANAYTIWSTDSSGNYSSSLTATVAGNSTTLEAFETTFQQDLNGDGTIGVPTTVIQTDGTTSLVSIGSNYFLDKVGSNATGPELSYNGAPVTAGEFGSWTPIGAVQTATGYDIAWKSGANAYTIWSTDSSGNYSSSLTATVTGNSTTLEAFETTFQQDLNGDGTIGVPTTVIQTDGTTSLVSIGSNYFLNKVGSNATGPELSYNGGPVTAGEFGSWTPIGAVQTTTGYDIAWKSGANAYTIWSTDSSGNYSSSLTATVTGNSTTLEAFETTFQQDLNGDGVITIPAGQTMELTGSFSGDIVFGGSTGTLKIDNSANFTGKIGGQLAIGDVIDLADISAGSGATLGYSGNNSPGTLTVSNGTHTANLALLGDYSLANFTASSDGHGGTTVVDSPIATVQNNALNQQLALLSQYMASEPPDASSTGYYATINSDQLGHLAQFATPIANHQHAY